MTGENLEEELVIINPHKEDALDRQICEQIITRFNSVVWKANPKRKN